MANTYILSASTRADKKYMIITPSNKKIHFGAFGYESYIDHKNLDRKANYISRHSKNENWTKSGIDTAGFWALWILWNKPTLSASIRDTENKFNIRIIKQK